METDMKGSLSGEDRGESVGLMEPVLIGETSRHRTGLVDLALELAQRSAGFRSSLPEDILTGLAGLVRSMNCYYSNLIEGHNTHPIDIERALRDDYSANAEKRNLQREARAHIAVQEWIDGGGLVGCAATAAGICAMHRRFCELLPEQMLQVRNPDSGERIQMVAGALRHRDVKVGRHIPVSPGAVPRFLQRLEEVSGGLGKVDMILAAATLHHRILWIHPFLDGNGRVARLMSYAMLLQTLDSRGLWSVARGLARNESEYKQRLMACDGQRRNDLDGRGSLSEEALAGFARFFLDCCIDQVRFMEELMQPERLRARVLTWVEEEIRANALPAQSGSVLEAVLYRGRLPRGEVAGLLGVSERHGRRIVVALLERGALVADGARGPLRLGFPARLAGRWMPGLFPDRGD